MSKHELCSTFGEFADAKEERAFLVLEVRRIILWAGSLVSEGEEIGGKGQQIRRASRLLRLHYGVCWRGYQKRSGPEIYPCINEARNDLLGRIAQQQAVVHAFPQKIATGSPRSRRGLRRTG